MPPGFSIQRLNAKLGDIHIQDDIHGPYDLGKTQGRECHQDRIQDFIRARTIADGPRQILP